MQLGALFDFVQDDTLSKVETALVDEDTSVPVDLTGGSVSLRFVFIRPGDQAISVPQDRAMTVTSAATGECEYQFQTGELVPGTLRVEVSATLASGKVITTKRFTEFKVRARL